MLRSRVRIKQKRWPCGHKTSIGYSHWPICPVCALETGKYAQVQSQLMVEEKNENSQSVREALAFSRAFSRQGCRYCGGV